MEEIQDSGITWISLQEMQIKKVCKHCHEPMEVKQLNLTEACRMCFNDKCFISDMDIPEVEYIQRSFRHVDSNFRSISDSATKVVSLEEEMQSINKLFSEVEGMLSDKVREQYKNDLLMLCSSDLVTKKPIVSPTLQASSDHKHSCEAVSLNSVSEVCSISDSNTFSMEQNRNSDLTNGVLIDFSISSFFETDRNHMGSINSQNAIMVQDKSTLPCSTADMCFDSLSSNVNGITSLVDTEARSICSEMPPPNAEQQNEELFSSSYLDDVLATVGINEECVDRSTEADSSGSLTNWLDTMVDCSEDISTISDSFLSEPFKDGVDIALSPDEKSLKRTEPFKDGVDIALSPDEKSLKHTEPFKDGVDIALSPDEKSLKHTEPFKDGVDIALSPDEKSFKHSSAEAQEKEVGYCKSENNFINPEEETAKKVVEGTSFPKEEKKTFRCYRPSRKHRQSTSKMSKGEMLIKSAPFDMPSNGLTSSHSSESYCQFSSWSEGSKPVTSLVPCTDTEDLCKGKSSKENLCELFGNSDVHEFPCSSLSDSVCAVPQLLQREESSTQLNHLLSPERQHETLVDLNEEGISKEEEMCELFVDSCSIYKQPGEVIPDTNEEVLVLEEEKFGAPNEVCSTTEKPEALLPVKASPKRRVKAKSFKPQRRRKLSQKQKCDKTVSNERGTLLSKQAKDTAEESKTNSGSRLGFTELSSFQGAKCSFTASSRRKSSKKNNSGMGADVSSNVSDEIENAIASVRLSNETEILSFEELLNSLS